MDKLTAHIVTFNCGRELVSVDHLAAGFFTAAAKAQLPPDLIVLCLQEISPIGYAFLGGSFLAPYFERLAATVHAAVSELSAGGGDVEYEAIVARNVGMTAIMVFAKAEVREKVRWMETGGVGVGVWDMGNKGAVGIRLGISIDDSDRVIPFTFVAAHLAPMEDACERRNQDWHAINEGLVFSREHESRPRIQDGRPESEPLLAASTESSTGASDRTSSLFSPPSYLFFAGDLNYRTSDAPPQNQEHIRWPEPAATTDPKKYRPMLKADQLTREREENRTLQGLTEAPIAFPPTYKYSNLARAQAQKGMADGRPASVGHSEPWQWARHRVPSWCDRILFVEGEKVDVHDYNALPVQPTSDHRPVVLSISVPMKQPTTIKQLFEVKPGWRDRRAAARKCELLVGIASYLAFTWEGEALLAGTVVGLLGGWVALRALLASQ